MRPFCSGHGEGMYDTPMYDTYLALASDASIAVKGFDLVVFLVLYATYSLPGIQYAKAFTAVVNFGVRGSVSLARL